MALKGSNDRYGSLAIFIHWLSALAIFGMFVLGIMAANTEVPAHKAALLRFHVPLGVLTLGLTLFRIVWLVVDRRPLPLAGLAPWQALAERLAHIGLYGLIVVMGFSGIAVLVLSGTAPILFFGSTDALPDFHIYPPMEAHAAGAFILLALLCLHIAAALYHHFVRHDQLLSRMGIGTSGLRHEE